jgi:sugar phosphate isomerase/epimerase
MSDFKIGVMVDSFRVGIEEGIRKAKQAGASGIQMYAVEGPMAPENLSSHRRKEILGMVEDNGLVVSAVCGDMGGGFVKREENGWRIEKSKRIMDLAKDLKSGIITTHIGVIPEDISHPRWKILQDACETLGEYGENVGAAFAVETGPEPSAVLRKFLDSLKTKGVKVNLDPANLVMVTGDDPVKAVQTLKDYIVHTHAKDGIMLKKGNPEIIYHMIESDNEDEGFREVPLGEGSVKFPEYLRALEAISYKGFLTIEREVGEDPERDIRMSVKFLNNVINNMKKV